MDKQLNTTPASSSEPAAKRQRIDHRAEPNSENSIEQIDPKGDLVVAVGEDPVKYMRVSGKHMTMISNVFEALLNSGFAESQSAHDTPNAAIKLPEDDPDAMRIMFQMAHHQIQDPKTVDVDALPQVLVACDKYDNIKTFSFLLREIWYRWLCHHGLSKPKSVATAADNHIDTGVIVEAVCMARRFGDRKKFKEAMKLLFKHANKEEIENMSTLPLLATMRDGFEKGLKKSWKAAVVGAHKWLYHALKEWIEVLADGDPICARTERRLGIATYTIKKYKLDKGEPKLDPTARFTDTEKEVSKILKELMGMDTAVPVASVRKPCKCEPCDARVEVEVFLVQPWKEHIASWGCACYECFKEGKYEADPEERGCKHE